MSRKRDPIDIPPEIRKERFREGLRMFYEALFRWMEEKRLSEPNPLPPEEFYKKMMKQDPDKPS